MLIFRCLFYIFVTCYFDAKLPLASTILLFEVPSLRVTSSKAGGSTCTLLAASYGSRTLPHVHCAMPSMALKVTPWHQKIQIARSRVSVDEISWDLVYLARNRMLSTMEPTPESHDFDFPNKTTISWSMSKILPPCRTLAPENFVGNKFSWLLVFMAGFSIKSCSGFTCFQPK